jgi:MoaA/NifB/PqqE/SkfB family radical SAM enzyme
MTDLAIATPPPTKFADPDRTARGEVRARVKLDALRTLWINTGTLCNIECRNCYIDSSPENDRLAYITRAEVAGYLDEIARDGWPVSEIGFTGGEPFMNPDIIEMLGDALARGHSALVLTNAMQPMLRPRIREGLLGLRETYRDRLVIRVSLDHYTCELHDTERGEGSFAKTVEGIDWLVREGFALALAGRTCWGESEDAARADGGMFEAGAVKLCHPHCAKFCVLGGGSCSA